MIAIVEARRGGLHSWRALPGNPPAGTVVGVAAIPLATGLAAPDCVVGSIEEFAAALRAADQSR